MSDFIWIDREFVVAANKRLVADTGEAFFLRSEGGLESALQGPPNKNHYEGEEDVVRLACHYLFFVGKAHAFEQGNKRTALVTSIEFLIRQGYNLDAPDVERTAWMVEQFIAGQEPFDGILSYMDQHVVTLSTEDIALGDINAEEKILRWASLAEDTQK